MPRFRFLLSFVSVVVLILDVCCLSSLAQPPGAPAAARPTLFLIGDSTVKNGTKDQQGWGDPLAAFFDPAKLQVINRARGGRSSRTFFTEMLWQQTLAEIKPGDFVLMQFGHNDGGSLTTGRGRASLKGNGDETQEVVSAATGKPETVHSYGWYLRKYIADTKAKGATPVVLSPIPRNIWKNGVVNRASGDYGKWASEAAKSQDSLFVDLNEIVAQQYDAMGEEKVKPLFGAADHTHTNPAGAEINAASVVAGLKALPGSVFTSHLSEKGAQIKPFVRTMPAKS